MVKNSRQAIKIFEAIIDIILNLLIIFISFIVAHEAFEYELNKVSYIVGVIMAFIATISYLIFGLYTYKRWEKLITTITRLFFAQILVLAISVFLIAILTSNYSKNFVFVVSISSISFAFLAIKKVIIIKTLHKIRKNNKNPKYVLIVGNGAAAIEYAKQLNDNTHFGYRIIGCVTNAEETRFKKLGGYEDLDKVIKEYNPQEVVISLDMKEEGKTNSILKVCDKNGIRASIIPVVYKYFKSKCQIDMIGNVPIINTRAIPLDNLGNAILKRLFDIIISLILIVLSSPVMLLTAIGVKLSSKGPIIFKQTRIGKNNKEFTIYKFRSMVVNNESDTAWTSDDDKRKTKFGTFIRKTGIDELPQLFNVLKGTMSIVGPRPELPKFVEEFSETIPMYKVKHQVKPGITGLAQIYGFRGDTSIQRRIELDLQYIENWSLFNDLKILVKTPFKMFNRNEKYVE